MNADLCSFFRPIAPKMPKPDPPTTPRNGIESETFLGALKNALQKISEKPDRPMTPDSCRPACGSADSPTQAFLIRSQLPLRFDQFLKRRVAMQRFEVEVVLNRVPIREALG